MLRVLQFFKTSLPETMGGIEQVIHQIALGGGRHGYATDVLSLSRQGRAPAIEQDGYTLHRAHRDFEIASTGFSASAVTRFRQLAARADVIHYHFPWPFMDLVHFASRVSKPTLVTYHSDIVRQKLLLQLYRPLMERFLGQMDAIVATSPNYLATSPVLTRFSDKVSIIPIGLDRDCYPAPAPERLRHWRGVLGERFFLFVGVLRYYKGLHILLQAMQGVDFPIAIVGAGPIAHELEAQARQLGLRNIHFLGGVSEADKNALLTLCRAVVFPSHLRSEAFGVSLLEGAMHGKPMISSEIGTGTTFVNIGGETGLVVPPSDPAALRQAMTCLWTDAARAQGMGEQAGARYRQYFQADRMCAAYARLYRDLAGRQSRSAARDEGEG